VKRKNADTGSSFSKSNIKDNARLFWFISEFELNPQEKEFSYNKLKNLAIKAGFCSKTTEANRVATWLLYGGKMPAILDQYMSQVGVKQMVGT